MHELSESGGRTVLFVSHNMSAVRALCPHTLWLDHGRSRELGPTADVIPRYLESGVTMSGAVDARSVERSTAAHGKRLRIVRVAINDGESPRHGQQLKIVVEFAADEALAEVSFGVGFASADGFRVMTIDSDLEEGGRDLAGSMSGRIEAVIPSLPLEPGLYSVDVAARSGDRAGLDYLPGCLWVQVLPGSSTGPAALREGGGVRLPALWTWRSQS